MLIRSLRGLRRLDRSVLLVSAFLLGGTLFACQSEPDRSVRVDGAVDTQSRSTEPGHDSNRNAEARSAKRDLAAPGSGENDSATPGSGDVHSTAPSGVASSTSAAPAFEGANLDEVDPTASSSNPPLTRPEAGGGDRPVSAESLRTDPLPRSQFVDFAQVGLVELGDDPGTSRFSNLEGFEKANDPEWDSVHRGRRNAPRVTGDFEGAVRGFDALVTGVMTALDDEDQRALTYLRISGHDYEKFCWPEFPQSRPVTNIPANESWLFLERRCHGGITHGLNEWGGQALHPVRVEFREGRADYANFSMWKGMVIVATRPGSEEEVEIDFAEVAIERNGLWKVYAFKD